MPGWRRHTHGGSNSSSRGFTFWFPPVVLPANLNSYSLCNHSSYSFQTEYPDFKTLEGCPALAREKEAVIWGSIRYCPVLPTLDVVRLTRDQLKFAIDENAFGRPSGRVVMGAALLVILLESEEGKGTHYGICRTYVHVEQALCEPATALTALDTALAHCKPRLKDGKDHLDEAGDACGGF